MSRELKFRAWDQDAHDWNEKYSTKVGGEHKPLPEMYNWDMLKEYSMDVLDGENQFKVMQYTGLKDKNGVEIYEGDVVCFDTISKKDIREVVRYEDGAFMPFFDGHYIQDEQGDWFNSGFEIIGNIHQHPELINQTN